MDRHRAIAVVVGLLTLSLAGCIRPAIFGDQDPGPGGLASDFLRPSPYDAIRVDLYLEAGARLDAAALADAKSVISEAVGKSVDFREAGTIPARGASHAWTSDELRTAEAEARQAASAGKVAVVAALVVAGASENPQALALAYGGSSVAFFAGKIDAITGRNGCAIGPLNPCGAPEKRYVTRSVVVHEMGHLFGLVNHGIPMTKDREDPQSPGHSTNPQSVMYKGVVTFEDFGRYLDAGTEIPYRFDADDLADLEAAKRPT